MRGTLMRRLVLGGVAALVLLSAGCENEANATPGPDNKWPASSAGIACQLLEYDAVEAKIGTRFDSAGGGKQDSTLTCALTEKNRPFPYLTLALTPTTIDSVVFTDSVKPAGAYAMPDLGVIAYRMTSPAAEGTGPALDLVWLSESSRLMNLRYGFAPSADQAAVDAMIPKLLALGQQVEDGLPH